MDRVIATSLHAAILLRAASLCVRIGFKKRTKMDVGIINTNPVVHEQPECTTRPHAADALDPLAVFGRVLQISPCESILLGSFSSAFS
jgi:hypothetical protein